MQTNSPTYLEIQFSVTRKGISLTPAPSYSMISVPLPCALPAPESVIHSPGWTWWSHLAGVRRSWIESGLMAVTMTRVCPPEQPGCMCTRGCGQSRPLPLQNHCRLQKVLEIRGGPGDWRKAGGTPGFKKYRKDPCAIQ